MAFEDYVDAGGLGGLDYYPTTSSEDYIDAGGLTGYYPTSTSEEYIDRGYLGTGGEPTTAVVPSGGIANAIGNVVKQLTGQQSSGLQGYLQTNAGNLTALLGLYALMGGNKPRTAGYAGSIPKLRATRQQVPQPAGRRPGGEAGRYFTDVTYAAQGGLMGLQRAPANMPAKAPGISPASMATILQQLAKLRAMQVGKAVPKVPQQPVPAAKTVMPAAVKAATMAPQPLTPQTQAANMMQQLLFGKAANANPAMASDALRNFLFPPRTEPLTPQEQQTAARMNAQAESEKKLYDQIMRTQNDPAAMAQINASKAQMPTPPVIPKTTYVRGESLGPLGYQAVPVKAADGGYLRGATGGMSDELDTTIEGEQPAKLSHGEFVVPADVVSHLGDGNSEAGAKKLYAMMDKVRQARTGKKDQAPPIKAEKYMPKMAEGGIARFNNGGLAGTTGSVVNPLAPATQIGQTGTSSVGTLAPWAGEYVTGMLGKAQALAEAPYQPYTGALTPGASQLQQQGFAGLGALKTPEGIGAAEQRTAQLGQQMGGLSYAPTTFGYEAFTPQAAQQYMNPYLQAALNPQLEEARRQADISRVQQAGRLTKAGAYGGSRQAIMESELTRNLGQNLASITGQGYNQAYQAAQQAFQADQARKAQAQAATEASRQFGAGYGLQGLQAAMGAAQQQAGLAQAGQQAGLQNIQAQLQAGAAQRDIEAQGLAADYRRFQEERDYPYKMLQYQQSFLQGLPIAATSYQAETSPLQDIFGTGTGLLGLYQALSKLGQA